MKKRCQLWFDLELFLTVNGLDFTVFTSIHMDNSLCRLLPKIELHAHLNGSISIVTLKELRAINEKDGESQADDEKWKKWEEMFCQSEIPTLSQCFDLFKVAHSVTVNPKAVQLATERVIEDFALENVIYLELRSTLRQEPNMTKNQYLESMIAGIKNYKLKNPKFIVKLIVSLNRKDSLEEAEENVNLAIEYSKTEPDIVVGIDLSGDPNKKKFSNYIQILDKARKEGLKLTIHFAEIPNVEETNNILCYHPDRLGHGTCVHLDNGGNEENWNLLLKSRIPVEVCLTSNVKCKTVPSLERHHFKHLYNVKHPIVICTDDKSVFQTNLTTEYEIVKSSFGLSLKDLWELNYNAVDYIFAGEKVKSHLKDLLITWKKKHLS